MVFGVQTKGSLSAPFLFLNGYGLGGNMVDHLIWGDDG